MKPSVKTIILGVLASLFAMLPQAGAFPSVTKIDDLVVDSQAKTLVNGTYGNAINTMSFQQDAVVTFNGWQYVTYYNSSGHVCVARRQLPSDSWAIVELTDYTLSTTWDSHNIISIGICPNDGTIHLSFDHHVSPLHYRVSDPNVATDPNSISWNASLFGSVRNYLEVGESVSQVTYPRFWQTPNGNLQMCYRFGSSGNGDIVLVDYNDVLGIWENTRMVFSRSGSYNDICGSSTSRNAYLNYPGYGPDGVLHITWCWREGSGGINHDICYAYSPDGGTTWYNNIPPLQQIHIRAANETQTHSLLDVLWASTGPQVIGQATGNSSTEQLINVNSPDIIAVPMNRQYSLMNQQSQAVDSQGRVHTVMWYATDNTTCNVWSSTDSDYHHCWRDIYGIWHHSILPGAVGSRPKLFIRDNGDAFMICRSGGLVIQAATEANQWVDWQIIHTEPGSFFGEPLGDPYRFEDGILSVMMQKSPENEGDPSPLHILDFQLNN